MGRPLERVAPALTRAWVRRYTRDLPPELRDLRRAEIESDLWEHQRDARDDAAGRSVLAREILVRLVRGIPDDLGWRHEAIRALGKDGVEWRLAMNAMSTERIRWMGVCGLLGGLLIVALRLATVAFGRDAVPVLEVSVLTAVLVSLGGLGLRAQHAGSGRSAATGFLLMLAGWGSVGLSSLALVAAPGTTFGLWPLLLNLGWLVMIPLGFLLLGLGLPSPHRYAPLVVGCYLIGQPLWSGVAQNAFPVLAFLFSREAGNIVMGVGLAAIGYDVWFNARGRTSQPEMQPQ